MSNLIPAKRKLFEKTIAGKYLGGKKVSVGYNAGKGLAGIADPKLPDLSIPAAPTIDETAQGRATSDRLRRRRGVLANIYSKGTGSPSQPLGG